MKKTWCKHIIWYEYRKLDGGGLGHYWTMDKSTCVDSVPKSWKMCPICGIERPTKANLAMWEFQALMDGDK